MTGVVMMPLTPGPSRVYQTQYVLICDLHTISLTLQAKKEGRCSLLIPETPRSVAKLYLGPDPVWAITLGSEGSGKLPYHSGYLSAHSHWLPRDTDPCA